MTDSKYSIDISISWKEISNLWQKSRKVKGYKAWISYHLNYGKYGPLANFGSAIINEYQIPYKLPKLLDDSGKKEN